MFKITHATDDNLLVFTYKDLELIAFSGALDEIAELEASSERKIGPILTDDNKNESLDIFYSIPFVEVRVCKLSNGVSYLSALGFDRLYSKNIISRIIKETGFRPEETPDITLFDLLANRFVCSDMQDYEKAKGKSHSKKYFKEIFADIRHDNFLKQSQLIHCYGAD